MIRKSNPVSVAALLLAPGVRLVERAADAIRLRLAAGTYALVTTGLAPKAAIKVE